MCHVQHTYLRAALTSEFQLNPSPSQHTTPGVKCCLREQVAWQGNGFPLPWVCDWQCRCSVAGPKKKNNDGVVWHDKASIASFLWTSRTCHLKPFKSTLEEFLWVKVIKSLGRRLHFRKIHVSLSSTPWVAGGSGKMKETYFL